MKLRQGILRIGALFLLLIFTQKIGIGLLLHNFYHSESISSENSKPESTGKGIKYACSCIDDFLVPFTAAEDPVISVPEFKSVETYSVDLLEFPSQTFFNLTLRGPPAVL